MSAATVDLRSEPASRLQGAGYAALRELKRGDRVTLLTAAEPSLLMQSLDLHLRHRLAWTITQEPGGWRIEVQHADEADVRDVLELLAGAHRALDALFVAALQRVNAGDVTGAKPMLLEFSRMLRRHVHAEDTVLAPFFGAAEIPAGAGPVAVMQREHAEIIQQLGLVEEALQTEESAGAEISAFCAILSGTLAKHEHREESNVFPLWRVLLGRRTAQEQADLLCQLRAVLAQ